MPYVKSLNPEGKDAPPWAVIIEGCGIIAEFSSLAAANKLCEDLQSNNTISDDILQEVIDGKKSKKEYHTLIMQYLSSRETNIEEETTDGPTSS